jgi:hypothetical protein
MMWGGASLNAYQAWRELLKEREHVAPLQLTPDHHASCSIDAMELKDWLRDVETNRCNLQGLLMVSA